MIGCICCHGPLDGAGLCLICDYGQPTADDARRWCEQFGFEFKNWDGTFCSYRDPKRAGTDLEHGLESHIPTHR